MIYYVDKEILIRDLEPEDVDPVVEGEHARGWHSDSEKFLRRMKERDEGMCTSLVAEYRGAPAGYINVYPNSQWGAFAGSGYPEIVDFAVLEIYRRKGIGGMLMDAAEKIAGEYADTVYLGVGLHSGYGSAQRMYVKRGYIPDGSGVWYRDVVCKPYAGCCNDDDLVLYLSKRLSR